MWEDELFDEIQKGDKVWYCGEENDDTVYGPAKAMMIGPAGWVCDKGSNYLGHTEGKDRQPDHFGHFMNQHND